MIDERAHTMSAGDFAATFLPERGMLGVSLTHRGEEILRLVDEFEAATTTGKSIGIPLNHPWANRLSGSEYRAAGRKVDLDPESPLLQRDWNDIIIHGVPWARLTWQQLDASETSLASRLDWNRPELLEVFPYEHQVEITASLDGQGLTVTTAVIASGKDSVPVSFGFHPYIAVPGLSRRDWHLVLPQMQVIVLDERLLPVGDRKPFAGHDGPLGDLEFDHGFAFESEPATMSIAGNGRRVSVDFLRGFPYAQIYAPSSHDHISLEPMTAPANALISGEGLRVLAPGERFEAVFRIRVDDMPE
ncbi:aldose 1-epimerase [Lysobacter korlensis]|uniref:Aldose 1-epimerase n=1 Tax=Lysobacter korlensis TaxID=553636 RepID=A0ABV6RQ38_9GAMM